MLYPLLVKKIALLFFGKLLRIWKVMNIFVGISEIDPYFLIFKKLRNDSRKLRKLHSNLRLSYLKITREVIEFYENKIPLQLLLLYQPSI